MCQSYGLPENLEQDLTVVSSFLYEYPLGYIVLYTLNKHPLKMWIGPKKPSNAFRL